MELLKSVFKTKKENSVGEISVYSISRFTSRTLDVIEVIREDGPLKLILGGVIFNLMCFLCSSIDTSMGAVKIPDEYLSIGLGATLFLVFGILCTTAAVSKCLEIAEEIAWDSVYPDDEQQKRIVLDLNDKFRVLSVNLTDDERLEVKNAFHKE